MRGLLLVVTVIFAISVSPPTTAADELTGAELNEVLSAAPDLNTLRKLADQVTATSTLCATAACVKTDCGATHVLQSQLWIAEEHLRAMLTWENKARTAALAHYNQIMSGTIANGNRQAFLQYLLAYQTFAQDFGSLMLNLTSATDFLQNTVAIEKYPWNEPGAAMGGWAAIADLADSVRDQLLSAAGSADTLIASRTGQGLPIPDWLKNAVTVRQAASDLKSALKAGYEMNEAAADAQILMNRAKLASSLAEKEEFLAQANKKLATVRSSASASLVSIGQIVGKVLLVWSQSVQDGVKDDISELEKSIDAETQAARAAWLDWQMLKRRADAMEATLARVHSANLGSANCLKSCAYQPPAGPPAQPSFVEADGKEHYGRALTYYAALVDRIRGDVAAAMSAYAVRSIDPSDPDAPEICKRLQPGPELTNSDPLKGLARPLLPPEVPELPARFCSDREKFDFDTGYFRPLRERARAGRREWANYLDEVMARRKSVEGKIAEIEKAGAGGEVSASTSRYLADLYGNLARLQAEEFESRQLATAAERRHAEFVSASDKIDGIGVTECKAPDGLDLNYPHLPETFCSEEERDATLTTMSGVVDRARKQAKAWSDYLKELRQRRETTSEATLKANLALDIDSAVKTSAEADRFVADMEAQVDKIRVAPLGECVDPCLVGTWLSGPIAAPGKTSGGQGIVLAIKGDGTITVDYARMAPIQDVAGGTTVWSGVATGHIKASDGKASLDPPDTSSVESKITNANGTTGGKLGYGPAVPAAFPTNPEYICTETSLNFVAAVIKFTYLRQE